MDEIIMNAKNKLLMALTVFLILFVLIGSVSAADDNTTALSQDNDIMIKQLTKRKFQLETMIPA